MVILKSKLYVLSFITCYAIHSFYYFINGELRVGKHDVFFEEILMQSTRIKEQFDLLYMHWNKRNITIDVDILKIFMIEWSLSRDLCRYYYS